MKKNEWEHLASTRYGPDVGIDRVITLADPCVMPAPMHCPLPVRRTLDFVGLARESFRQNMNGPRYGTWCDTVLPRNDTTGNNSRAGTDTTTNAIHDNTMIQSCKS